jgi:hypothetical protein
VTFDEIMAVYTGSNADATHALYATLSTFQPRGYIAINLIRTCKASERAKKYRGKPGRGGPSYRQMAYDKKDWSIDELCRALVANPDVINSWGWGRDAKAIGFENVLYVDIPGAGQVSFHTEHRRDGPDFSGRWDGARNQAPRRICRWTEAILAGREVETQGEQDAVHTGTERNAVEGPQGDGAPEPQQAGLDI